MSGYCHCACRDCFDTAITNSASLVLCLECSEAGCDSEGKSECQRPDAYGAEAKMELTYRIIPSIPSGRFLGLAWSDCGYQIRTASKATYAEARARLAEMAAENKGTLRWFDGDYTLANDAAG